MKKIYTILCIFLFFSLPFGKRWGWVAFSQELTSFNIPDEVYRGFSKDFPQIQNPVWEKKKGTIYKAKFSEKNHTTSAYYDWIGILLRTDILLLQSEIPAAISEYVRKQYHAAVTEVHKVTSPPETKYHVFINNNEKEPAVKMEILFDEQGGFLKELYECGH